MIKAYYILRQDLGMTSAKRAVQVGHGTDYIHLNANTNTYYPEWLTTFNRRKIILRIKDESALQELCKMLLNEKIPFVEIKDAGLTEFNGEETLTGIMVYPYPEDELPKKFTRLQTWKDE
jgi:peptidyl-tRNA hydrolase